MRNYFPKRKFGAPLPNLSKLYDVSVGFVNPPPFFEALFCYICVTEGGGVLLDVG